MKNRNPIKQWFITFPQKPEEITKANFHTFLPPSCYVLTCEEEHKDGGLHLHMVIKLVKGLSHSKLTKWLSAKFPEDWKRIHYKGVKVLENAIDYCHKEDPLCFEIGEPTRRVKRYTMEDAERDVMSEFKLRMSIKKDREIGLAELRNVFGEHYLRESE